MGSQGLQPLAHKLFNGLYETYDRTLNAATLMQDRYWKWWLLRKATLREGMQMLDVGCGTGVLEERIAGSGVHVAGVDLTEEMIRLAQSKRIECLESLAVADGERLPYRDASFDLVLSCYVVKYCRPAALAKEVSRVLRPGGRMMLYDFSRPRGLFAPFHAFYVYGVLRIFGRVLRPVDPGLAFTYQALPGVIEERRWDDAFSEAMEAGGFSEIGEQRLTGGVVTIFWGKKS